MRRVYFSLMALILGGCSSAPIALPSNVTTVPTGMGQSTYIDKIDHSFIPQKTVSFGAVKVCAASTFTNDSVVLKDNAGSFVGAYTGRYYQQSNSQQISGGNVFKLVDDQTNTLIATGNKKSKPQQGGLIVDYIKYDAKIVLANNHVQLVFQNIQAAQQSTGSSANDGFRQIGTWSGARAPAALETIHSIASNFKNCLN